MITVMAQKPATTPVPLNNSSWYRNEDIFCIISIDDGSVQGNSLDLSSGTLKLIVKESTIPASPPLHEYTSAPAGGITITHKNADKIIATVKVDKAHLASLSPTTEITLEAQLIAIAGAELIENILHIAKFTSKVPI